VHERKLQLCAYSCGDARRKEREWILDSDIQCVIENGGASGQEGLVVGLEDGRVLKVYVDNPFPIELVKSSRPVRAVACSCKRSRLAVIDSDDRLTVYELQARHQTAASVADEDERKPEAALAGRVGKRGQKMKPDEPR
jgi:intraflagellar transport protein 122